MKKLLVIATAFAGFLVIRRKMRDSKIQKSTWSQATDTVN
ncbi:DLW-39 family protein [Pseudarthrobacter sp. P1]